MPTNLTKLVIVLGVVCTTAALALASVYDLTKERIAEQIRLKKVRLLSAVLPPIDNEIDGDFKESVIGKDKKGNDIKVKYFFGRMNGQLVGTAFSWVTPEGFSGDIEIMMGVSQNGEVTGVEIVRQKETPGLGDKILKKEWRDLFRGKGLTNVKWAVKKDGGEFDQFAGATITPRAVVKAVKQGLEIYQKEFGHGKG